MQEIPAGPARRPVIQARMGKGEPWYHPERDLANSLPVWVAKSFMQFENWEDGQYWAAGTTREKLSLAAGRLGNLVSRCRNGNVPLAEALQILEDLDSAELKILSAALYYVLLTNFWEWSRVVKPRVPGDHEVDLQPLTEAQAAFSRRHWWSGPRKEPKWLTLARLPKRFLQVWLRPRSRRNSTSS